MNALQNADVQPTAVQLAALTEARELADRVMARWAALRTTELAALNRQLAAAGLPAIVVAR
jgi:hypothetical protein